MRSDARLDANSLWTGEYVTPRIHPDALTDSPGFNDLKMTLSFINNFLPVCSIRLILSVLLDHNSVYIVRKRELSTYVSFYSIPAFP